MNARADIPPALPARVIPLPVPQRPRLAEAVIVPVAEAVTGLFFDASAAEPAGRARLGALIDDVMLGRPVVSTRLALRNGGARHLLLAGRSAESLLRRNIVLTLDDAPAALIDPRWLQPPMGDGAALIEGLSADGRRRLVKLFLTAGPLLFGAGDTADFGRSARRLLDLLGVEPLVAGSVCPLGRGVLLSYRVTQGLDADAVGDLVALAGDRSLRPAGASLHLEQRRDHTWILHVHLPRALPAGARLVGLGPALPAFGDAPAGMAPRALVPWLERRSPATRTWVHGLIERAAADDPAVALLAHEMAQIATATPSLSLRFLAGTSRGVLYAFDLADREDLVQEIRLTRGSAHAAIGLDGPGPVAGHVVLPRHSRADDRLRLQLVLRSGRLLTVSDDRLGTYRGELPEAMPVAAVAAVAAAVARAQLERDRRPPAPLLRAARVDRFGPVLRAPVLRLVVPAGDMPDGLRARAALLGAEAAGARVEIICHGSAGPVLDAARAAIEAAAGVHGIAHRLVQVAEGADPAERLLAALTLCAGAPVLVLGDRVLPEGRGWLAGWLRRLGAPWAVLGGTLLDHERAVLHAGGSVLGTEAAPARLMRPHLGLRAADLPRRSTAIGTLVTADCVGLAPEAVERLIALGAVSPMADVLLSAVAGQLRAEGAATGTFLAGRFLHFGATERNPREAAVAAHALGHLKRSFSLAREEGRS